MIVSWFTRPMALAGYHLPAAALTFVAVAAGSIGLAKAVSMLPFGSLLVGAQGRRKRGGQGTAAEGAGRKPPMSAGM